MNAFKRYVKSKGIRLSCDYPELPYYIKGKSCFEPGYIFVDDVYVDSEKCTVTTVYNVIVNSVQFCRDGSIIELKEGN